MLDEDITLLTVPGWQDSGPGHWQTLWERNYPLSMRVEQSDWERPVCADWVAGINRTLAEVPGPVVIAAHSLGVLAVLHWAAQASLIQQRRVRGALLVAPPDLEADGFAAVPASGFAPLPRWRLPFRAILVASQDDSFCRFERAATLAGELGAQLVDAGAAGHINSDAGYGYWPQGQRLLQQLMLGA
jgi:hypothetical protein